MSNLYEINGKLYELIEKGWNDETIDYETGEIFTDKVAEQLNTLELERTVKHENIALLIKNYESDASAIKTEELVLKQRREQKEKKVEFLKKYLAASMNLFGDTKLDSPRVCISFRKSESINITNEMLIPEIYKTKVEEWKVNKSAIKSAIKAGEQIEGAELQINQNLQIK